MKCVQTDGKIVRVKDNKATELVKAGGKYVGKKEWRQSDPAYPERQKKG